MKKKKNPNTAGLVLVAIGIGIVTVCIFPSQWMIIIMAAALVFAGVMLMKR